MHYHKSFYQIKSNEEIFERIVAEKQHVGYYALPFQDTSAIKAYAASVTQSDIVVVGIGGSSLGTYAIHQLLVHKENTKKLHFLESTDPIDLKRRIEKINLKDALFLIVSKSGTTIETVSILKYLHTLTTIDASNTMCITERDSQLDAFAKAKGLKTFEIPKNVGGRFSVFSAVGLVPLAIMGLDIDALLQGAKEVSESFFTKQDYYDAIMEKARFTVENKNRYNINVLFSYSSLLEGFNKWYVQLWGESLGKININGTKQSFTPIGIIGPVDQHSFLQLIMEGKRDKSVTFITVEDFKDELTIPKISLPGLASMEDIGGVKFKDLINQQAEATIGAINALGDIPYDVITLSHLDEHNIAKLMYAYMLLTSVVGCFVQIDTYDQPGVEAGKVLLKNALKTKTNERLS